MIYEHFTPFLVTSLPGTISITNRAPGSPVPKPRTKKPGDVSRSPIPPSQPNGSIYSAIGGGEGGRGDSVQSVVPSASDYEVPVQSIRQLNHGKNSASSLKEEEVPPPPPPRRKGGSQGTPGDIIIDKSKLVLVKRFTAIIKLDMLGLLQCV